MPKLFGTGWVPVLSVPMKLPRIRFPAPDCATVIPSPELPEMTLRAPAVAPPIRVLVARTIVMPVPLPSAAVPSGVVPMRLPWTTFASPVVMRMPSPLLPESRSPPPAAVPPIVLPFEL